MKTKLSLRERQVPWSKKIIHILESNFGYIDTSVMGAGKTLVALHTAKRLGLKIFVVCPALVKSVWKREAAKYGIDIEAVLSYGELRSTKNKQPSHGYLKRIDTPKSTSFTATKKLKDAQNEGCLIIIDEFQEVKNKTAQWAAVKEIIDTISKQKVAYTKSRFGCLSGTAIDKQEQALNLFQIIGLVELRAQIRREKGKIKFLGMTKLLEMCQNVNEKKTEEYMREKNKNVKEFCWYAFTRILKDFISGSMPAPEMPEVTLTAVNGYYKINKNDLPDLKDAIDMLSGAVASLDEEGNKIKGFSLITKALMKGCRAKANDLIRIVSADLDANPNFRAIISVDYTEVVDYIMEKMKKYKPVSLTGQTKGREKIVEDFQNQKIRLIVKTTKTGQSGISLHDTDGDYPRGMYIIPGYSFIAIAQNVMRIWRDGTKSDTKIVIFYGKGTKVMTEKKTLEIISRKNKVVKEITNVKNMGSIKFPGDYDEYIEK